MYAYQICVRERQKHKIIKHLGMHRILLYGYCPETIRKTKLSQTLHILGHLSNNKMQTDQKNEYIPRRAHLIPAPGLNNRVLVFLGFNLEQSGLSYQVPFGLGSPAV